MDPRDMDRLIDEHIAAELAGDSAGAITMYTHDVEHDVVGWPTGPVTGREAAQGFYDTLMAAFHNERMEPVRRLYGEDFCVIEHMTTGSWPGGFAGVAGGPEHRTTFRMLHIWEFRDGRMSRENVWIDSGAIIAQLIERNRAVPA
jgi:hypothetical protein